jgi:cytochrome c-type biogenesis protein
LLLLAYGSQAVIRSRRDAMMAASNRLKPVLGGLLILAGLFVVSGFDKVIEAFLTARMPEWLTDITLRF